MKKVRGLIYFTAWLIVSIALAFFSGPAQAYIYDEFTNRGIDPTLWVEMGPDFGVFSQPGDGYLYFNNPDGGKIDKLRSYNPVSGAFTVAMQYSSFQAVNDQPSGVGQGSNVRLMLEDGSKFVAILEYKNASGLGFQAIIGEGTTFTSLNIVPTTTNSGWLEISYNGIPGPGGDADLRIRVGAQPAISLASVALEFSQAPYFSIRGSNFYGESLNFQVDQVQVSPTPLPASVLLLGTGLLGLAGCSRLRKR